MKSNCYPYSPYKIHPREMRFEPMKIYFFLQGRPVIKENERALLPLGCYKKVNFQIKDNDINLISLKLKQKWRHCKLKSSNGQHSEVTANKWERMRKVNVLVPLHLHPVISYAWVGCCEFTVSHEWLSAGLIFYDDQMGKEANPHGHTSFWEVKWCFNPLMSKCS